MSFALSAGVTGLQAHQKMLDIAGNNLANVNTTAFKSSRITFSELLSETIKKASQPTTTTGGTNPQQMGTGVGVAGITPNMSQGNIINTGNPLDLALEGEGYFDIDSDRMIKDKELVIFKDGDKITVTTREKPVRFLLISGKPIKESIAWYGPIVMNTQEELRIAFEEYRNGTFIK